MPRSWRLRIEDILESLQRILRYTEGFDADRFLADDLVVDAVIRNFEVVGTAAKYMPKEIESRFPEIPWIEMRGMRNLLAHEYFGVDRVTIWRTIEVDRPPLIPQLQTVLQSGDHPE
ncbi:MAG: DUF86 domain-containing protein [Acidobacteriota bacterium]